MTSVAVQPGKEIHPPVGMRLLDSPYKQALLLSLVLVVATVALYYPVHRHPFANIDDDGYISDNAHVKAGLQWETIKWALTTYDDNNWHPLTWLSLTLDCQFFGPGPGPIHDSNVALHALNAVLLLWVLWRATGYLGRSFMVAALFALHPINVESVAWIAERKTMLSMVFFLLALGAYRWYAREPRVSRYVLVALLYWLGLMSKPQVITFPAVLLLWDYWPLRRMFTDEKESFYGVAQVEPIPARKFFWLVLEKVPLGILSLISAYVTMKAQQVGRPRYWLYSNYVRTGNAIVSYARYVGKAFWPSRLAIMYPHPGYSLKTGHVIAGSLFLLAVTVLVAANWRRRGYLLVGWLWFLGTLVPMIGVIQVGRQALADRYAYISFVGLFIMVCWGIADWAGQRHVPTTALAACSIAVLMTLAVVARRQIDYWSDNIKLWSHALQVTNDNWVAEDLVGGLLMGKGNLEQAMPYFYRAAAIQPTDPSSSLNIGAYEQRNGNLPKAIEQFKKVLTLGETRPDQRIRAYINLGHAYHDLGDYADSRDALQNAVRLSPRDAAAWIYLGVALQRTGDVGGAIQAYSHGMEIQGSDWGYVLLAGALQEKGQTEEAQAAFRQARLLSRNFDEAQRAAKRALGP